jgi:pyruvate/2-oxoglutarate dehydrogenase complex dihydrolipoamide dehydrogenase (E3) component
MAQRAQVAGIVKVVCKRDEVGTVLGIHIAGPSASEMILGYAAALSKSLTMQDLSDLVSLHPTGSEEVTLVHRSKRSGLDPTKTSC